MAAHHIEIWPYWKVKEWMAARDARLFELQELLDGAFHILGALSAANRLYFSPLHMKRMGAHIALMKAKPPHLARRLESLFSTDGRLAAEQLRQLTIETVEIVESHIPGVDTGPIRKQLASSERLPITENT